MNPNSCPACFGTATMKRDATRDINHIDCPSCGPYAIDDLFHARIMNGPLSSCEVKFIQHDMAGYIREERPDIVGSCEEDPKAHQYWSKRQGQRERRSASQVAAS